LKPGICKSRSGVSSTRAQYLYPEIRVSLIIGSAARKSG
jgi:hypothetical protein